MPSSRLLVLTALALTSAPAATGPACPSTPPMRRQPATAHRPALIALEPGRFIMATPADDVGRDDDREQAPHPAESSRGLWMAETEVTQGQYHAVIGRDPSRFSGAPGDRGRPVENVTWRDAIAYCNALSAAEGLPAAYRVDGPTVTWDPSAAGYRLPTEAEWEYAARAGTRTATYAGDLDLRGQNHAPVLDAIAWYGGNSGAEHPRAWVSAQWPDKQHPHRAAATHPVGRKRANPWGLHDMIGNVWEWTWDRWAPPERAGVVEPFRFGPPGPAPDDKRVMRGGAFGLRARFHRAGMRDGVAPTTASDWIGFRPVRNRRSSPPTKCRTPRSG